MAGKVATDTAEKLKLSAEELDTAAPELEWLQTPENEPTPSPELPKSPPTSVPSPHTYLVLGALQTTKIKTNEGKINYKHMITV